MEYRENGQTRLEVAKGQALRILDDLPAGSRVAVFDSAEAGGEWQPSTAHAREHIDSLQLRHANAPITRQLRQAYRLLDNIPEEQNTSSEETTRLLYIFSDRTLACWDSGDMRDVQKSPATRVCFVDVGVDNAKDVGITNLELSRQVIPAGGKIEIKVSVQATGANADCDVICRIDNEAKPSVQRVKCEAGPDRAATHTVVFERQAADRQQLGLAPGFHHLEVKLQNDDSLPFDDVRYATFEVRSGRRAYPRR